MHSVASLNMNRHEQKKASVSTRSYCNSDGGGNGGFLVDVKFAVLVHKVGVLFGERVLCRAAIENRQLLYQATHPQHVTVIGRRLPFNYPPMSAPQLVNRYRILFFFYVRYGQFGIKKARWRDRGRHPHHTVMSSVLAVAAPTPNTLLGAEIFKSDTGCKQKMKQLMDRRFPDACCASLKRCAMHPCGRTKSFSSWRFRSCWKYSTWERCTSRDKSPLQPLRCP